jgi:hypothetical protein
MIPAMGCVIGGSNGCGKSCYGLRRIAAAVNQLIGGSHQRFAGAFDVAQADGTRMLQAILEHAGLVGRKLSQNASDQPRLGSSKCQERDLGINSGKYCAQSVVVDVLQVVECRALAACGRSCTFRDNGGARGRD